MCIRDRQTPGVERVGVSTAGEVDARTGVIRLSDNIPGYTGLNLSLIHI